MVKLRLVPPLGKPIEIDKDSALIGRELTCDVVLNDGSVSRRHAKIERIEGAFKITDQGSANGTFLDSQRITGSFLKNGQELRLGGMVYRVEVDEPATPDLTQTVAAPAASSDRTVMHDPLTPPPSPSRSAAASTATGCAAPAAAPRATIPPPPAPASPRRQRPPPAAAAAPAAPRGAAGSVAVATPVRKGKGPLLDLRRLLRLPHAHRPRGRPRRRAAVHVDEGTGATPLQSALIQLGHGDADSVYADLDESYRGTMTLEDFQALVQEHPGLADFKDATFWSREDRENRATLSVCSRPSRGEGAGQRLPHDSGRAAGRSPGSSSAAAPAVLTTPYVPPPEPVEARNEQASRRLVLTWDDGHVSAFGLGLPAQLVPVRDVPGTCRGGALPRPPRRGAGARRARGQLRARASPGPTATTPASTASACCAASALAKPAAASGASRRRAPARARARGGR